MIVKMVYANVNTDISFSVESNNSMALRIKFKKFDNGISNVTKSVNCVIPFTSDIKYNKNISISLIKNGKLIIDERLDDPFYYETQIDEIVDKICWFTIPAGYNNPTGLNALEIIVKGGV